MEVMDEGGEVCEGEVWKGRRGGERCVGGIIYMLERWNICVLT